MSQVYSTLFLDEASASGDYTATVPDDEVWVIRDIQVGVGVSLEAQGLTAYSSAGGRWLYLGSSLATTAFESFQWTGRVVYLPSTEVKFSAFGTIDFVVCGYKLSYP